MKQHMNGHYDFIGDVHGYAGVLEALLTRLGYQDTGEYWHHEERTAIFVGDLIDRGHQNLRTLAIVKAMVDHGSALAVLGNHEFNALCYHTTDGNGDFLRRHSEKNTFQHRALLAEITDSQGQQQWTQYLEWFRRLPLFLEMDGFRVVHACWDERSIDVLKGDSSRDPQGRLTDDFLTRSTQRGGDIYWAIETILKGEEIPLPAGYLGVHDKEGILRKHVRLQWWLSVGEMAAAQTYHQVARVDDHVHQQLQALVLPEDTRVALRQRRPTPGVTPIFIGHYWFHGTPRLLSDTVVSLDYSVAKGGLLVSYRWDGEPILDPLKLIYVANP